MWEREGETKISFNNESFKLQSFFTSSFRSKRFPFQSFCLRRERERERERESFIFFFVISLPFSISHTFVLLFFVLSLPCSVRKNPTKGELVLCLFKHLNICDHCQCVRIHFKHTNFVSFLYLLSG